MSGRSRVRHLYEKVSKSWCLGCQTILKKPNHVPFAMRYLDFRGEFDGTTVVYVGDVCVQRMPGEPLAMPLSR